MTRVAAWALNKLLAHPEYELGSMAVRFNGDDGQWDVDVPVKVTALLYGRMVAVVEFDGNDVSIFIPNADDIIRRGHLRDFVAHEHNIIYNTIEDFKGDTEDDMVADITVDPDMVTGLDGPRRMVPKSTITRQFKIKGQLNRE